MVQVKVNEGILEGKIAQNKLGGEFYSFKGIPYAEPPVGPLRFKAPVPKKPWGGVRAALEHGPSAYQADPLQPDIAISEDCLFLNVYSPELKPRTPLPVMVFIHGGGFSYGSGDDGFYGPDFLVRKGVILVTINYRLEVLGFLCLDTEDIPGNAGMKDQVQALRWVKNNIHFFGGDSDNITIFGESAGSASCSFHLVSPMSKGLFKRAILQSGALTSWWPQAFEPRERAIKLAKQLGCNSEDDKEVAEFFQNVPAEELVNRRVPITLGRKPYETSFVIADEKQFADNERFFYGDVVDVVKKGIHEGVTVMTGYTRDEGSFGFCTGSPPEEFIAQANDFHEFFVPSQIQRCCPMKDQIAVGRKVRDRFCKNEVITRENISLLLPVLDWDMFLHGSLLLAKLISEQTDVYLYKFTCYSGRNTFASLSGLTDIIKDRKLVCHSDDLSYLFSDYFSDPISEKSEEYRLIDTVTTIWTNFAKFGHPTPDNSLGVKWSPYNKREKKYLEIGNQLVEKCRPNEEDEAFYDDIFKQYLPKYYAS